MKKSWFVHSLMTDREAEELILKYRARGVKTIKNLAHDPRYVTVSALLPTQKHLARTGFSMRNSVWR